MEKTNHLILFLIILLLLFLLLLLLLIIIIIILIITILFFISKFDGVDMICLFHFVKLLVEKTCCFVTDLQFLVHHFLKPLFSVEFAQFRLVLVISTYIEPVNDLTIGSESVDFSMLFGGGGGGG